MMIHQDYGKRYRLNEDKAEEDENSLTFEEHRRLPKLSKASII